MPGAFGRRVNAWYIWVPLCILFVAPFIPWRRRPSLWHLDLLVLSSFSVSLAFFNHAKIGLSVPLVYPPLIYLMIRLLLLAGGRGIPRRPLRTVVPASWLAIGTVFLMAFRIGLNILNSNVIDVGYSGVIGADKLIHSVALYGHWPHDNMYGDTYGPVSYMLYVPFRLIFGWSGTWDSLPAAHGAAIFFDLLCVAGLYLLGRRLRGNTLGVVLAYLWAAYPFTLYALNSNTNDSLVAAALVFALLAIRTAPGRGLMAGSGRDDQVRTLRAGAAAAARDRGAAAQAPHRRVRDRLRGRVRAHHAAGAAQARPPGLLARLDRLPVRPHHAVLDLGAVGRAGLAAEPAAGRGDRAGPRRWPSCRRGGRWWTWPPWVPGCSSRSSSPSTTGSIPTSSGSCPWRWWRWWPVTRSASRPPRRRLTAPPRPSPSRSRSRIHIAPP